MADWQIYNADIKKSSWGWRVVIQKIITTKHRKKETNAIEPVSAKSRNTRCECQRCWKVYFLFSRKNSAGKMCMLWRRRHDNCLFMARDVVSNEERARAGGVITSLWIRSRRGRFTQVPDPSSHEHVRVKVRSCYTPCCAQHWIATTTQRTQRPHNKMQQHCLLRQMVSHMVWIYMACVIYFVCGENSTVASQENLWFWHLYNCDTQSHPACVVSLHWPTNMHIIQLHVRLKNFMHASNDYNSGYYGVLVCIDVMHQLWWIGKTFICLFWVHSSFFTMCLNNAVIWH